jgi:thiol:disulfide interchange protein DsbC
MVKYGVIFLLLLSAQSAFCASVSTTASNGLSIEKQKQLKQQLNVNLGLQVITISVSPMEGLLELVTNQGLFYSSVDGQFLVQGKLYGIAGDTVVDHTEFSLGKMRIDGLGQFEQDMIVYPAKNEKYVITVFTDITCGYCRQMHEKMDEYNAKGITVKYMAYPRAGVKDQQSQFTQGFKDLRSIWCHEDPNMALTKAKAGSSIALRICDKRIAEEFNFGRQIGVNSTPAIILPNGMLMPGYRKPDDLLNILQSMSTDS